MNLTHLTVGRAEEGAMEVGVLGGAHFQLVSADRSTNQ